MEKFLYFAETTVETGDDALPEAFCVPASSYVGVDPYGAAATVFKFRTGDGNGTLKVKTTHTAGKHKDVVRAMGACLNSSQTNGGFVRVFDLETGTAVSKSNFINPAFNGLGISAVSIINTSGGEGVITGELSGTAASTSYGAGAVGTGAGAPQYARTMVGDIIMTTIRVDITGLKAKGGNAGDAIGLGTTPAYIYKNVVAENGIIFRQNIRSLEVPTSTNTVTDDINLAWNSAATIDYDEAAGTGSEINAGALALLAAAETDGTAITANHYAYLTEGTTEAADAVFTAGVYLITLYGAKLPVTTAVS